MPRTRPPYPPEFKRQALELLKISGKPLPQIAKDLGVSDQTLRNWPRQAEIDTGRAEGLTTDERAELREPRRRVRTLEMESGPAGPIRPRAGRRPLVRTLVLGDNPLAELRACLGPLVRSLDNRPVFLLGALDPLQQAVAGPIQLDPCQQIAEAPVVAAVAARGRLRPRLAERRRRLGGERQRRRLGDVPKRSKRWTVPGCCHLDSLWAAR
jgi:transposase